VQIGYLLQSLNFPEIFHRFQGFEMLSAGLSGSVNGAWQVIDADQGQGLSNFSEKGNLWQTRRALAKHFWQD